jgi:anti-sigma B factor antagonist
MQLSIESRELNGVAVVSCGGRIVFGDETARLRETIKDLIGSGHSQLVLDLSNVNYVDSTGVGVLVSSFTTARNAGGDVKLAGLTRRVNELLQIVKLLTVFDTYENADLAVSEFHRAQPARLEAKKHAVGEN